MERDRRQCWSADHAILFMAIVAAVKIMLIYAKKKADRARERAVVGWTPATSRSRDNKSMSSARA